MVDSTSEPAGGEVQAEREEGARTFAPRRDNKVIYLGCGFVVIGLVFCSLQFSTDAICCGDFDGYYHTKWSRLLWEGLRHGQFPPAFTWLPLTTLNAQDYVDHHLLFHLLQVPFTVFGDGTVGAKISAMLFATLAVFSCFWLIVRYGVRYPLIWLVALLGCSTPFLYRMSMAKAMSVSIVFLVVGIHLLFSRKYLPLLPLAFLFALTYDMFVLLGVAAVIWAGVVSWSERRLAWRPVLYVAAGSLAGFVINPYFPHNFRLLFEHVLMKATGSDFTTQVGSEWYPYDSWDFLKFNFTACVAMVAAYIAFDGSDAKRAERPLFLLVFTTVLLVANARWRRFAEYFPPFAVVCAAFAMQRVLERGREAALSLEERWNHYAAPAVVALALCGVAAGNIWTTRGDIASSARRDTYLSAATWLRGNVPKGDIIFNADWDSFPRLFYYAEEHRYVSGLDPTYLLDRDRGLAELYDNIRFGRVENPAPLIRERFGARYVFINKGDEFDNFYNNAIDSGWFEQVYEDDDCSILHVLDSRREPPPDEPDEPGADEDDDGPGDG